MNWIAVFARWPEPGRVKSRLSPALPPALACRLHEALLRDTLEAASAVPGARAMLHWSDAPADRSGFPLPRGVEAIDQQGADLGARLARGLGTMLERGGGPVVAIGTDCPELNARGVAEAFAALDRHEVVLGPTRDGGYYLIGLARPLPALFTGIDWGTDRVLAQTRARAREAGIEPFLLEPLADVDTPEDLIRLIARCAAGGEEAPHTRAALKSMGLLPAG
jgi:hypothetical protein